MRSVTPRPARRLATIILSVIPLVLLAAAGSQTGCGKKSSQTVRTADPNPLPADTLLSTAPEVGQHGGRLIIAETSDPKTFNYIVSNEQSSSDIDTQLFEGLVTFNNVTQQTEPALAKSWELGPDSLSWIFHLRDGIRFSDGTPITSADFAFMHKVVMDTTIDTSARNGFMPYGKPITIETPDEKTVIFHMPVKFGKFPDLVAGNLYCEPKHILEAAYSAHSFAAAYGVSTPPEKIVTSGPWKVKQYVPGEKVVLAPNPYYYVVDKNGKRLPYLDELVYVIVPDQNTEVLRFQGGETDAIENCRPEDFKTLERDAAAKNYTLARLGPSLRTSFFWMNLNLKPDRKTPYVAPYKYAWFSQKAFRQALAYAVDRDAMARNAYFGLAVENWGPMTKGNKNWHDPNVTKYPYNPSKSQALLAGLGYKDSNGDGYLEDPAGHTIEFTMLTNSSNNLRVQLLTMLQADFKKIGVKLTPKPVDFNDLVSHIQQDFQYEAVLLGLNSGVPPDPGLSLNVWKSSGFTHFWYVQQPKPSTPWEAHIDTLMDRMVTEFDQDKRRAAFNEVQELVTQQCVFIYLPSQEQYVVYRNKFGNIRPTTIPPFLMWNAREIFLKAGRPAT
jgi:peptide/nickel transport system substrate-binding protein